MSTLDQIRAEWQRLFGRELKSLVPLFVECEGQACGCNERYLMTLRAQRLTK